MPVWSFGPPHSWGASGFGDVSFSDEEIIDFLGFVHVYLDECSRLGQFQAPLLVMFVQ